MDFGGTRGERRGEHTGDWYGSDEEQNQLRGRLARQGWWGRPSVLAMAPPLERLRRLHWSWVDSEEWRGGLGGGGLRGPVGGRDMGKLGVASPQLVSEERT